MYRVWIALAALLGFAVGSIATFLIGIEETASWECDGPCFDRWDEVSYVSLAAGAITALGCGLIARRLLQRRFAKAS